VAREPLLIVACDELHDRGDLGDGTWERLRAHFGPDELVDLLMLIGWYHAISWFARAARVDLEPFAPRFADVAPRS
jgi:hypothetical protein